MTKKILAVLVLSSLAGVASAGGWHHGGSHTPPRFNAPEIEAASAGSALTLLLSGLAVLRGRASRRK